MLDYTFTCTSTAVCRTEPVPSTQCPYLNNNNNNLKLVFSLYFIALSTAKVRGGYLGSFALMNKQPPGQIKQKALLQTLLTPGVQYPLNELFGDESAPSAHPHQRLIYDNYTKPKNSSIQSQKKKKKNLHCLKQFYIMAKCGKGQMVPGVQISSPY